MVDIRQDPNLHVTDATNNESRRPKWEIILNQTKHLVLYLY